MGEWTRQARSYPQSHLREYIDGSKYGDKKGLKKKIYRFRPNDESPEVECGFDLLWTENLQRA
jgi:hypothetical protein